MGEQMMTLEQVRDWHRRIANENRMFPATNIPHRAAEKTIDASMRLTEALRRAAKRLIDNAEEVETKDGIGKVAPLDLWNILEDCVNQEDSEL